LPQTEQPLAMQATRETVIAPRRRETGRWTLCIGLALGIHAAAAAVILPGWNTEPEQVANAPLILVELETLPVAPAIKPTQAPPGPQQQAAANPERPKPMEKTAEPAPAQPAAPKPVDRVAALPPEPKAELQTAPASKSLDKPAEKPVEKKAEKPVEKKPKPRRASLASAPSTAERKGTRAAAPAPGAASNNPDAVPNWKSQLVARLERYKRYPEQAQARGEHGVAQLAFSIDRSGGVHRPRIVHSSGSRLLDAATLALVERAAPLPPPPREIAGAQIAVVVPIKYNFR
jgi:periplasmic protein TonB